MTDLLITIDKTIDNLKNSKIMLKPEDLYQGFNPKTAASYRKEAMEKYGEKVVLKSEEALMSMDKEDLDQMMIDFKECNARLFALRETDLTSEVVQSEIENHYNFIRRFWGTSHLRNTQAEAYAGLGDLYVEDERFTTVDGEPQPEFARFLREAMAFFSKTRLQ